MEELLSVRFSWGYLLSISLLLLGLFFVLQFTERLLEGTAFLGGWQLRLQNVIRYLKLIYEPLSLIVVGGIFILINPVFHGLLLIIFFLSTFPHLRNYIAGRIIQLDRQIDRGVRLRVDTLEGVVLDMNRLSIQLQTKAGLNKLTYTHLLNTGYTLISGDEIGGFYHLRICPKEANAKTRHLQQLNKLFLTTPFLDWSHRPELNTIDDNGQQIEIRILVREESHLNDLIALIREWGYDCSLKR